MDKIWEPEEAGLGDYYAGLTTTTALGLIFGPPMPIVYLITALIIAASYFANKCSLVLQILLYGGLDYFSVLASDGGSKYWQAMSEGEHMDNLLSPPDLPIFGLLALVFYALFPVQLLPFFT
ncbi:hypothetical protein T492DRAFT_842178 [Pavlovales sp. CCMP2436]|nr:hypothetical protein T492DRAFT_842178 [Pavlovales sp. CCMP2436]